MISILAPAKINLTLEVLGRRPDGFHEIKSVIQAIDLYDTLSFEEGEKIEVVYEPPQNFESDLVFKAIKILKGRTGCPKGGIIRVKKVIPPISGLGGGSSDAAATLKGLNRLWGLRLSQEELMEMASQISSDTPFFIFGGTALVEGRGERVIPLPTISNYRFILLFPEVIIPKQKTKYLYQRLRPDAWSKGEWTDLLVQKIREGKLDTSLFFNAFESIAFEVFPGLQNYWTKLAKAGAEGIHLAGSGPTLFTIEKGGVYNSLLQEGLKAYLAQPVKREDE